MSILNEQELPKQWEVWKDFLSRHGMYQSKVPMLYVTEGSWRRRYNRHGGNSFKYAMSLEQQVNFLQDHWPDIEECQRPECPCHTALTWPNPDVKVPFSEEMDIEEKYDDSELRYIARVLKVPFSEEMDEQYVYPDVAEKIDNRRGELSYIEQVLTRLSSWLETLQHNEELSPDLRAQASMHYTSVRQALHGIIGEFLPGDIVHHPRYGNGIVLPCPDPDMQMVTVQFGDGEKPKMLSWGSLAYTKLKKVTLRS